MKINASLSYAIHIFPINVSFIIHYIRKEPFKWYNSTIPRIVQTADERRGTYLCHLILSDILLCHNFLIFRASFPNQLYAHPQKM